jgi:electron transport complex protein RnfG
VAVIYSVTKDPIAAAATAKTNKAIEEVVPAFDNNPSEEVLNIAADLQKPDETNKVYVAKKGGEIVGYAIESTTKKGF